MADVAGMENLITAQISTYQHTVVGAARQKAIIALTSRASNLQSIYSPCRGNVMANLCMQVLRQ